MVDLILMNTEYLFVINNQLMIYYLDEYFQFDLLINMIVYLIEIYIVLVDQHQFVVNDVHK